MPAQRTNCRGNSNVAPYTAGQSDANDDLAIQRFFTQLPLLLVDARAIHSHSRVRFYYTEEKTRASIRVRNQIIKELLNRGARIETFNPAAQPAPQQDHFVCYNNVPLATPTTPGYEPITYKATLQYIAQIELDGEAMHKVRGRPAPEGYPLKPVWRRWFFPPSSDEARHYNQLKQDWEMRITSWPLSTLSFETLPGSTPTRPRVEQFKSTASIIREHKRAAAAVAHTVARNAIDFSAGEGLTVNLPPKPDACDVSMPTASPPASDISSESTDHMSVDSWLVIGNIYYHNGIRQRFADCVEEAQSPEDKEEDWEDVTDDEDNHEDDNEDEEEEELVNDKGKTRARGENTTADAATDKLPQAKTAVSTKKPKRNGCPAPVIRRRFGAKRPRA